MAHSIETLDRVTTAPLGERYKVLCETEGKLHHVICTRMVQAGYPHYMRLKGARGVLPDTTHLKRKLGVMGSKSHGKLYFSKTIAYEEAVALSRALGMDPHEAGV